MKKGFVCWISLDDLQSRMETAQIKDVMPIQDVAEWSKNLTVLPSIESCDIMAYLVSECGWETARLTSYNKDNGYKLHLDNHISNVTIANVADSLTPHFYVKASCVPETRQTEAPYAPWVLLNTHGQIVNGGCSCVV